MARAARPEEKHNAIQYIYETEVARARVWRSTTAVQSAIAIALQIPFATQRAKANDGLQMFRRSHLYKERCQMLERAIEINTTVMVHLQESTSRRALHKQTCATTQLPRFNDRWRSLERASSQH
jgi:hypothetical protein